MHSGFVDTYPSGRDVPLGRGHGYLVLSMSHWQLHAAQTLENNQSYHTSGVLIPIEGLSHIPCSTSGRWLMYDMMYMTMLTRLLDPADQAVVPTRQMPPPASDAEI